MRLYPCAPHPSTLSFAAFSVDFSEYVAVEYVVFLVLEVVLVVVSWTLFAVGYQGVQPLCSLRLW